MNRMEENLRKEMQDLGKLVGKIRSRLKTAPNGSLQIKKKRGYMEYYYRGEDSLPYSNGQYVRKKDIQLVKRVAQRDYDELILKNAEVRIQAIDTFLKKYEETDLQKVYREMHPFRKNLLSDVILPEEEYAKQWERVEYKGKPFRDDGSEIITERGERVRSKSEKIIADKMHALGISYRYEYPLLLDGGMTVYPDFTILKKDTREEVYLEHFGRMDDNDYVGKVMLKLNTYARNKIYPGINLFFTYETNKQPLNIRALDDFLKQLFWRG